MKKSVIKFGMLVSFMFADNFEKFRVKRTVDK